MEPTVLTYLENQNLYKAGAQIVDIQTTEDGRVSIILDHTIFYPQGGGQPYDQGIISTDEVVFEVQEVRFVDGLVYHIGTYSEDSVGEFQVSTTVQCEVDEERRMLNAREHSAGHLIGMVMQKYRPDFNPTKGHHFPGECYVAYEGEVPEEEREAFREEVEELVNTAIAMDIPNEIRFVDIAELETLCDMIPLYVPRDKPCRIASVRFDRGNTEALELAGLPSKIMTMPCGGTHVSSLGVIKGIRIKKCSSKKGVVKLSYECV